MGREPPGHSRHANSPHHLHANSEFRSSTDSRFDLIAAVACLALLLVATVNARGQDFPAEDFGPYNAIFLSDGPGLTKTLAPPSPMDSRAAALLDRFGLKTEPRATGNYWPDGPSGHSPSGIDHQSHLRGPCWLQASVIQRRKTRALLVLRQPSCSLAGAWTWSK